MEAPAAGQDLHLRRAGQEHEGTGDRAAGDRTRGKPYDRAAASEPFTVTADAWTELHVTFQVDEAFPARLVRLRELQAARLPSSAWTCSGCIEGEYVPYQEAARQEALAAAVNLFDTGVARAAPLPGEALARASRLGPGAGGQDRSHVPRRCGVAQRPPGRGAAPRRAGGGSVLPGAERLALCGRAGCQRAAPPGPSWRRWRSSENGPSEVIVDAAFQSPGGKTLGLRYALAMGQLFVKTEPPAAPPVAALSVEAPCRFVVLPDFFADDIVIDAAEIPVDHGRVAQRELPAAPAARRRRDRDDRGQLARAGRPDRASAGQGRPSG